MSARDKWTARIQVGETRMFEELQEMRQRLDNLLSVFIDCNRRNKLLQAREIKRIALNILKGLEVDNVFLRGTGIKNRRMRAHFLQLRFFFNPEDISALDQAIDEIEAILDGAPDEDTKEWAKANGARLALVKLKTHTT